MADEQTTPAIDIAKIVADTVKAIMPTVAQQIADAVKPLADNQKILADTLTKLPPAGVDAAAKKDGAAGTAATDQPKFLTAEDLVKVLDHRDKARSAGDTKKAARQKVVDTLLKGAPEEFLAGLPDTDDEAALTESAKKIRERITGLKIVLPDVGGASRDGGVVPGSGGNAAVSLNPNLSPGVAKYAAEIK